MNPEFVVSQLKRLYCVFSVAWWTANGVEKLKLSTWHWMLNRWGKNWCWSQLRTLVRPLVNWAWIFLTDLLAKLVSTQARRNYLKCVLVHKCLHGLVPLYLLSEFRHRHFFHGYNTGSHDLLCSPFAKTSKYQGNFRINGTQTFNTLPRNIRVVEMFSKFKIKLKCHLKQ